jgi:hypothetical protein
MPTDKERYTRTLNEIAARYGRMEDATVRAIIGELRALKAQIAGNIAGTDWDRARLDAQRREADRLISELEQRLKTQLDDATRAAFTDGGESAVKPLQALGLGGAFYAPSLSQLNTIIDFNSTLITAITEPIRAGVDRQIYNVVLGQQTPAQAMQNITKLFGYENVTQNNRRVSTGISAKAEMDVRTELQRVYNLSNNAQQQENAKRIPGLLKRWIATADNRTRRGHLRAHLDYSQNPIPVANKFKVYDITPAGITRGSFEMMYPADPAAPVQYSVNCRCRMATIHPEIGVIGSTLDGRVARIVKQAEAPKQGRLVK